MKIIQNNMPVSPEMDVICGKCNSVFHVEKDEGRWLKPYSSCESDRWMVPCPVCGDPQYYPKMAERERTWWEKFWYSYSDAML